MDIVTYSLLSDKDSDEFYFVLDNFVDEVKVEAQKCLADIIEYLCIYLDNEFKNDELILNLLILSVYIKVYKNKVKKINNLQYSLFLKLKKLRSKNKLAKSISNYLRGVSIRLFLVKNKEENFSEIYTSESLKVLVKWLKVTDEFNEEVRRLEMLGGYINNLTKDELKIFFIRINDFGNWFTERSEEVFERFTYNVNDYLRKLDGRRYYREDQIFCGKSRVEYHLNMVGSEIINRLSKDEFLSTNNRVVLLPKCITSPVGSKCMSEEYGTNFECKKCSNKCQVNEISILGEMYGFKAMVVPHESSISSMEVKKELLSESTGVVGVACVLNLLSGGGILNKMSVPAQCVLLDYCGCKAHWHKEGIVTRINMNRLIEKLGLLCMNSYDRIQ